MGTIDLNLIDDKVSDGINRSGQFPFIQFETKIKVIKSNIINQ